jgi:hypothetical protein
MAIIADDYSPVFVGDTGAPFDPVFVHKDGTAVDLTGATITMIMVDAEGNAKTAAGIWTIISTVNGQASYSYAGADVAVAGNWTLYITITINSKSVHADTKQLEILAAPTP